MEAYAERAFRGAEGGDSGCHKAVWEDELGVKVRPTGFDGCCMRHGLRLSEQTQIWVTVQDCLNGCKYGGIFMNFNKIHHIAIIGSSYEKTKHFYVDLLGFEVVRENYREERDDYKIDLIYSPPCPLLLQISPAASGKIPVAQWTAAALI